MNTISYIGVNGVILEIADAEARTNITGMQTDKADKSYVDSNLEGINSDITSIEGDIQSLFAAVGTPLVASTAAQMVDTLKIYVYVGSETGYNTGHWYYWNGSAWADGGIYNSTAFETDKTLTVENAAADADVTGAKIRELKSDFTKTTEYTHKDIVYTKYVNGRGISASTGAYTANPARATSHLTHIRKGQTIFCDDGWQFALFRYNASGDTVVFIEAMLDEYTTSYLAVEDIDVAIVVKKSDNTNITTDEINAFDLYTNTPVNALEILPTDFSYTNGLGIYGPSGTEWQSPAYKTSEYIPVRPGIAVWVTAVWGGDMVTDNYSGLFGYDENKQLVGCIANLNTLYGWRSLLDNRGSLCYVKNEKVIIPDNVYYVRLPGRADAENRSIEPSVSYNSAFMIPLNLPDKVADAEDMIYADYHDSEFWTIGYWAVIDGTHTLSAKWARSTQFVDDTVAYFDADNMEYNLLLQAYNGNNYVGSWNGTEFATEYNPSVVITHINMIQFKQQYPAYSFRLSLTRIDRADINLESVISEVTIKRSIIKQHTDIIQTIYGDIAQSKFWENGTIAADGTKKYDYGDYRISTNRYLRCVMPITITPKTGYVFSVTVYTEAKEMETQFSTWSSTPYTMGNTDKLYKIVIKSTNPSEKIHPNNIANYIETRIQETTKWDRLLAEYATVRSIGHRGFNKVAPENTIPAFEMSAAYGFKYVETDILFTHDGIPVLMHDATLNRTCCNASDGSALTEDVAIADVNYSDLAQYDACTPRQWPVWHGVKIPTFEDFMHCCRAYNFHPWIELKNHHDYTASEIQEIISIVKRYGMEEHVTFISFSYNALVLVKNEWDTVELGYNGPVEAANNLKTGKNRVFMVCNKDGQNYVDAINAGYQICFYQIDYPEDIVALPTYGFDSVLTNCLLPTQVCDTVRAKYESATI